jgi:hypothetical protein
MNNLNDVLMFGLTRIELIMGALVLAFGLLILGIGIKGSSEDGFR